MPFTFSHPAAVLPFKWLPRRWRSMTALIVGSVVPDFESFLSLDADKSYSHSILGAFLFDFPLGLLLCFLFHGLVRKPLIDNLPRLLKRKFFIYRSFDWLAYFPKNVLVVILSLVIGIGSHLLWDRFTHANEYLPGATIRVQVAGYETLLFMLVQYVSSGLGLLIIALFLLKQPSQLNIPRTPNSAYWVITIVIAIAVCFFRLQYVDLTQMVYRDIIADAAIFSLFTGIIISSAIKTKS